MLLNICSGFMLSSLSPVSPLGMGLCLTLVLILSILGGRLAIIWAARLHFYDHPGERKLQSAPVPLLGGVAIIVAVICGGMILACSPESDGGVGHASNPQLLLRWLGAGLVLLITGLIDDRRGLSPQVRLAVQAAVTCAFIPELGGWLGGGGLFLPAVLIGGVWTIGLINSLNFLDNMDAASGSAGFWVSVTLATFFYRAGQPLLGAAALVLGVALAGFLWWNKPVARLYMGDAGSTFVGFSLAVFTVLAVLRAGLNPWLVPILLAVPLYDTCTVFWIRWREGRPLWIGDRRHVTHRMTDRGRSVPGTIAVLNMWSIIAAITVLALQRMGRLELPALIAAVVIAIVLFGWERKREKTTATVQGD
ncbi:MAG: undecaprenyl/decaprenyl-phosphate alpha-N-acetylglucosaminyl 1-phosphate transferase [bacterium]|nr:undecaprenyl/decaprenyl-phosphate alpha-N-acetylglucosaminyl 1-phosphate transferase [bacterium]